MSSLKVESYNPGEKAQLNTTIDKAVFDAFKRSCKESGVPMNVLLEAFMRQFAEGEYILKLGRRKRDSDIELRD